MVLQPQHDSLASAATNDAAALATALFYETANLDDSPSLSLCSTPALSFAPTPETPYSVYDASPVLGDFGNSGDSFGNDYPIFAHESSSTQFSPASYTDSGNTFAQYLDPVSPTTTSVNAEFVSAKVRLTASKELFVNPMEIQATTPAQTTSQDIRGTSTSPAISMLDYTKSTPPAYTRSHSDSSVFAVPKLPRGRKRKVSTDATASGREQSPAQSDAGYEADEKAMLRAKNTESAARSRLRKKLELENALQRTAELEAQLQFFKHKSAIAAVSAQKRIGELESQVEDLRDELRKKQ